MSSLKGTKMMFTSKLVASIRANGKILREYKDKVYIPYGSEYSVLLKNLNSVRALVHVYIDGTDTTPDGLVLNPGQDVDYQRSIANENLKVGNSFKFVERSSKIEDYRGIKLEDGIIRVEFQFEHKVPYQQATTIWQHTSQSPISTGDWGIPRFTLSSNALRSVASTTIVSQAQCSEVGITVPGSINTQQFAVASWFPVEVEKHSIVLQLLGETPDNKVTQPVTVSTKLKCVTCGVVNKSGTKYCRECGTALRIV